MKLAAPKRIEMASPSLWARPAYAKATIKLLSRIPQPAIDTGTVAIKSTGGMRKRTCAKLTGAATALTQHHAAATVSKWIATEHAMTIAADRWELQSVAVIREAADKCRVSIHRSSHCRNRAPISTNINAPVTAPNPIANRTARAIES